MEKMKRGFSLLLALVMVLSLVPVGAWAEEPLPAEDASLVTEAMVPQIAGVAEEPIEPAEEEAPPEDPVQSEVLPVEPEGDPQNEAQPVEDLEEPQDVLEMPQEEAEPENEVNEAPQADPTVDEGQEISQENQDLVIEESAEPEGEAESGENEDIVIERPGEVSETSEEAMAGSHTSSDVAYAVTGGNIYFRPTTGAIVDCDESVTKANIPVKIGGSSVTSIGGGAFWHRTGLIHVSIPNSVTSIGSSAFSGCTGLTKVNIPESVTSIEYGTFYNCTSLRSVTIPTSVTSIGENAFKSCRGLTSVTIPDSVTSIGKEAFFYCSGLKNVKTGNGITSLFGFKFQDNNNLEAVAIGNRITSIESRAFNGCTSLSSVSVGNKVKSIGESAFGGCTSLTKVTIPNSVTSIGSFAFGSSGLTNMIIPNSVTSIGSYAFRDCTSLTSVSIPNSVTSIEHSTFNGCTSLTNVNIPNSVTSIGHYAFQGTGLTVVDIPDSVTSIRDYAFHGCNNLRNVNTGNGVTSLNGFNFQGNKNLARIVIGNRITTIEGETFGYCGGLTSVSIGSGVKTIEANAFQYCTGLTRVTIPNSVTNIEYRAFYGCKGLTNVTIGNSVTSIGISAFSNCKGLTSVRIGDSVKNVGDQAFSDCTGLTRVIIPNSVTSIGRSAFRGCTSLTSVSIGSSVKTIETNAFQSCTGLTRVTIPNSVTTIGERAFYECTSLSSVTIPNSVASVGNSVFQKCRKLKTGGPISGSYDIQYGWTDTIPSFAFSGSQLASVTIPREVSSVGTDAFKNCNELTDVYYDGDQSEWERMVEPYSIPTRTTVHYNTAGPGTYISVLRAFDGLGSPPNIYFENGSSYPFDGEYYAPVMELLHEKVKYTVEKKDKILVVTSVIPAELPGPGTYDSFLQAFDGLGSPPMIHFANGDSYPFDGENYAPVIELLSKRVTYTVALKNGRLVVTNVSGAKTFTFGRDNNSFSHWKGSGDGFEGVTKYTISDDYFQMLISGMPEDFSTHVKKYIQKEKWTGACHGLTTTIGFVFSGYLGLSDISSGSSANFYSLPRPCTDSKLLNTIHYYQLMKMRTAPAISSGDEREHEKVLSSMLDLLDQSVVVFSYWYPKFENGEQKVVGHTILACDYKKQSDGSYLVDLCDVNNIKKVIKMTISSDFSSFSFTDGKGRQYNENNYISIEATAISDILRQTPYQTSGGTTLILPMDGSYTITSSGGKTLTCSNGVLTGTMEILSSKLIANEENSEYMIEVKDGDTYRVTTTTGSLDFTAYGDAGYASISASNAMEATVTLGDSILVKNQSGKNCVFSAYVSTDESVGNNENNLIALSATASSDVTINYDKGKKQVTAVSNGALTNAEMLSLVGTKVNQLTDLNGNDKTITVSTDTCTSPTLTKISNTTTGVKVSWDAVPSAEKYRVFRKVGSGSWEKVGDTTGTSLTDKKAVSGKTNSYKVRAFSNGGSGSAYSAEKKIKYIAAPKISKVENVNGGMKLTWGKVSGAAKYRLYRKAGSGSWEKIRTVTETSYIDKTVVSGTKYAYKVRCIASDGTTYSAYGSASKAVRCIAAPKIRKVENVNGGMKLTWGKVSGAAKYRLYRKAGSGSWEKIRTVTGTSYTDKTVVSGTKYAYKVRCIASDGTTYSAYGSASKAIKYIATPTISKLEKINSGVRITWDKVKGAEKYSIFRKTGNSNWSKLADTTAATYNDRTTVKGKTYSYSVRCISSDGKTYTSGFNTTGKSITR